MAAYIIVDIELETPAALADYQALARPTMEEYGIRLLGKGPTQALEGTPIGTLQVLLEADSPERARQWHASPGYQEAIAAREGKAKFTMSVVTAAQ
ncbi:MAG: DUF1330 domain-containing protein [Myxococcota bacterium]